MNNEYRREVDELVALYEREPSLRDVYVEGAGDKRLVAWFLKENGITGSAVYEIDAVNLPPEKVLAHGLPDGQKGRVVVLARELDAALPPMSAVVTCIADSDFDLVLEVKHECKCLLLTEHTCIEMYALTPKVLRKFFDLVLEGLPVSVDETIANLYAQLPKLFLFRLANETLSWHMAWLSPTSCCPKAPKPDIDFADFVTRYLSKNSRLKDRANFESAVAGLNPKLVGDSRRHMHGEDLLELLDWYVRTYRKREVCCGVKSVRQTLLGCMELEDLKAEKLFQALMARVTS